MEACTAVFTSEVIGVAFAFSGQMVTGGRIAVQVMAQDAAFPTPFPHSQAGTNTGHGHNYEEYHVHAFTLGAERSDHKKGKPPC